MFLKIACWATLLVVACTSNTDHSCGSPIAECQTLCQEYCSALLACGMSNGDCLDRCSTRYKCPGETRGQDNSICHAEREALAGLSCSDNCKRSNGWSGCGPVDAASEADTDGPLNVDAAASE